MKLRKFTVRIHLCSGTVVTSVCRDFKARHDGSTFTKIVCEGFDRPTTYDFDTKDVTAVVCTRETWFAFLVRVVSGLIL